MANVTEERKKELLTQFNENAELREVVREELLRGIYSNGVIKEGEIHNPKTNWALGYLWNLPEDVSMEDVGKKFVAMGEGIRFVETAFDRIVENYKVTKTPVPGTNKAR